MAVLPLNLARVSNTLRTNLAQRSISRTQSQLVEVQNQIATGRRLISPSDDPNGSAISIGLRKTLEQRTAYAANLRHASSQLSEVDSTLGDLTGLVREAQTIASANVGSIVTADERRAAASVIENLLNQAVSLGNREFQGLHLFGGDAGRNIVPFSSSPEGVRFNGSERVLENQVDQNTLLPFLADGNQVFGALSTRIQGNVDLSPALTGNTRLADLAGATGAGVALGSIQLSDGTTSATIDLSSADSIGDLIDLINAAAVGTITASIAGDGNSLQLNAGAGDDITVNEVGGGTTAASLGILNTTAQGPGVSVDGLDVGVKVTPWTQLADLRGGLGIDQGSGIVITNGATTKTISFAGATTVEDLLNAVNSSGTGVLSRINEAGTGIDILNPVQGIRMTIGENGGTTASDLGIRSFSPASLLTELNNGRGVQTTASGDDVSITRRDGTSFTVDLSGATTVQNVIDAINAADAGGGLAAGFATTGNGIVLTDTTGGAGNLIVGSINGSTAAQDLGLAQSVAADTITGTDVNFVEPNGLFGNLAALKAALLQNDQTAITSSAEALQEDLQRVIRIHGQIGAQVKDAETRLERLEDQNVATKTLLSDIEDTDFDEAITRFQSLQTTLQANLQTTGRLLNLSLLDFLG